MACVLLIMAGPFISACDSGGSNSQESSDAIIPLEKGNQWTVDVSGEISGTLTAEVTGENQVEASLGDRQVTISLSTQSEGVVLGAISGGVEDESDVIRFKYPAEDGETYQHTDGDGTTYQVAVSRTSISVPAGDYEDCVQYTIKRAGSENVSSIVTLKPGVGPIKWEEGGGDVVYELASTNVGG